MPWTGYGCVIERTTVVLLRLRHQLTAQKGRSTSTLYVEEAAAIGWSGVQDPTLIEGLDALGLLEPSATADPPPHVASRALAQTLELLSARAADLDTFAQGRADTLLADHRRVREASEARGSWSVKALLPVDVIGLYVLLPKVS